MTNQEILKKHIPEHQIWGNGITGKPFLQNALLETVLSALEEARNQGRGEGPVWVKAESELPKPFVNVSFRIASVNYLSAGFYDDKAKRIYCNCLKQLIDNGFKEIEWLIEPDKDLEQSKKEQ